MIDSHALLVMGASGSGKSHMLNSALRYYGSGIVLLAPGVAEINSYYPLNKDPEHYDFVSFDDSDFGPLVERSRAHAAKDVVKYLTEAAERVRGGLERKVLAVDTGSALGEFALYAALDKYGLETPPPVRGEKGFPFFRYLLNAQRSMFAKMQVMRGLGLHWIMASQVALREVSEGQSADESKQKQVYMPMFPGGFRDTVPQYFDLVVQATAVPVQGQPAKHVLIAREDNRHVTKSRLGDIGVNVENTWTAVLPKLEQLAILRESQKK